MRELLEKMDRRNFYSLILLAFAVFTASRAVFAQTGDSCIAPGGSLCENSLVLELSSGGPVVIEMFPDKAPNHVRRMKELTRSGFYDGLTFHRATSRFIVQTGDPTGDGKGGSGRTMRAEFNDLRHLRGTVSAAHDGDPDSADSQFFIMLDAGPHLDGRYTAWGRVTQGMDYVDLIVSGRNRAGDVAEEARDKILSMRVLSDVGLDALQSTGSALEGIYALQMLSDFDTLEGVSIDPASGAFTLVGRKTKPGRFVPYLDYLKVAMELPDDASFSLRATRQWQREVDNLFKKSSDEVAEMMMFTAGRKKLARAGMWMFTNCGIDMTGAFSKRPSIGAQLSNAIGGGVRVIYVVPGMTADRAGLRKGDRIVEINGAPVRFAGKFIVALRSLAAGQVATLKVEAAGTRAGSAGRTIRVVPEKSQRTRNDSFGMLASLIGWGGNPVGGDIIRALAAIVAAAERSEEGRDEWAQFYAVLEIRGEVDVVINSGSPEAKKIERILPLILESIERKLRLPTGKDRFMQRYYQLLRQAPPNMAFAQVIAEQLITIAGTFETHLDAFLTQCTDGYMYFPSQMIADQFGLGGYVVAEYDGIPANSLVARTVMAADVVLKQIPYQEMLSAEIPAYRTWADFKDSGIRASKGSSGMWGHMWIANKGLDIKVSEDGRAMSFGQVPMRFRIEEYVGKGKRRRSRSRPDLDAYANHLSNLYPELAQIYPALHELRELTKIIAVAKWFRDKGFRPDLPDSGTVDWQGSAYSPGVLSIAMDQSPKPAQPMAIMTVSGGVDLHVENLRRVAIEEHGWHRDLVVVPEPQSSRAIQRLMSTMPSVPPLPKPDGWIRKAELGDRKLAAVTVLRANGVRGRDVIESQRLLDQMERKALVIQHYDNMINEMTADRMRDLRGLDNARRKATEEVREMSKETLELLTGGLISWDSYISSFPRGDHGRLASAVASGSTGRLPRALQVLDRAKKVRSALDDLRKLMEAGRDGTFNKEAARQLAKRAQDLAEDVMSDLQSLSPEGRRMTSAAFQRVVSGVKAAFALNSLIDRTVTIFELEQTADLTNTELGRIAQLQSTVNQRRAKAFKEFQALEQQYRRQFPDNAK